MKRAKPYEGPQYVVEKAGTQTLISKNIGVKKLEQFTEKKTVAPKTSYKARHSKIELMRRLQDQGLNFQTEQSHPIDQQGDILTNSISVSSRKKIWKPAGEIHIIDEIKNTSKLSQQLRQKYDIEGPAMVLQVNEYTVILAGRFEKIFQKGQIVGLYIPPKQQRHELVQRGMLEKTVIIKRAYENQRKEKETKSTKSFKSTQASSTELGETKNSLDLLCRPYIVLDPYNLLYPTYICTFVECKRKITIQHYIQSPQIVNIFLAAGSACHRYLQCLVNKQIGIQPIEEQYRKVYNLFMYDMFLVNMSFEGFLSFCENSLKNLNIFYRKYLMNLSERSKDKLDLIAIQQKSPSNQKQYVRITGIIGPQVMLKSQYFGLKGKVDLLLQGQAVKFPGTQKEEVTQVIIPFQLKTGKRESDSHRRQVEIYLLIIRQIYRKPALGMLYYSETDRLTTREENSQQSFISVVLLRNQIISNILKLYKVQEEIFLPDFASNLGNCSRKFNQQVQLCEYAWQCGMISNKNTFKGLSFPSKCSIKQIDQLVSMYSETQANYFREWLTLLHMQEFQNRKNSIRLENLGFNDFQISSNELSKLLNIKQGQQGKVQISMFKKFKSHTDISKITNLFENSDKIRFSIPQLDLIQGAKIASFFQKKKVFNINVEMNNKIVGFSLKKLQLMVQLQQSVVGHIQKFQNSMYGSMRNTIAEFIKKGQKKLRQIIIDEVYTKEESKQEKIPDKFKSQDLFKNCQTSQLNSDQKNALQRTLKMDKFLLVQGLPGTGKTYLITKMIQAFSQKGMKILISTFTNRSLDNILERLIKNKKVSQDIIIRQGSKFSIPESLRHLHYRSHQFNQICEYKEYFDKKSVWFVTMSSLYIHHIPQKFDIVIVDQASQCLEPLCIQAIQKAQKFILIGDTKQLQSVVSNKKARNRGMGKSLFERLLQRFPQQTVSLKIQYRMCKSIMNLSNRLVYNGQLSIDDDNVQQQRLKLSKNWQIQVPSCFESVINPEKEIVFINIDPFDDHLNKDYKKSELQEDKLQHKKLRKIMQIHLTAFIYKKILFLKEESHKTCRQKTAIICAYNSTVSSILQALIDDDILSQNEGDILTIDKSQGIDKETIIFLIQKGKNDIVDNQKRLNVALTRAKSKLIIIGSNQQLNNMNVHDGTLAKLLEPHKIQLTRQMMETVLTDGKK